jgi:hypothetical protein
MNVLFTPEIYEYFDELEDILYDRGYYSFKAKAKQYVEDLINDIATNLPNKRPRPAPKYYDKYEKGMYFVSFVKNRNTHWYAFFTKHDKNGETIYLVHYIGNNHTEAHHLYEGF